MNKFIYTIALLVFLLPTLVFASPSSVDRITDHIEPLIKSDYIKATYYAATSTTATSTFAGKLQMTKTGNSPQIVGWDDDTGIHFDGPDILSFHTGAVQRMIINALGYVGIGTTSPYARLSVVGQVVGANFTATTTAVNTFPYASSTGTSVSGNSFFAPTTGTSVVLGTTTSQSLKLVVAGPSSLPASSGIAQTGIARITSGTTNLLTSTVDIGSFNSTGAGWIQSTDTANLATNYDLLLNPNGGDVGIGTTSPYKQLSLTGDLVGTNLFATSTIVIGTTTSSLHAAGAQIKGNLQAANAGSEVSLATAADVTGRSGVSFIRSRGTIAAPTAVSLDDSLGFVGFKGYDGVSAAQLPALVEGFVDGTVSSGVVPARLSFVTGSSGSTRRERFVIKNDGKIGVATTSPWANFTVTSANAATSNPLFMIASSSAAVSTSTLFMVDGNGNVGIATTSPYYPLSVNGNAVLRGYTLCGDAAPLYSLPSVKFECWGNSSANVEIGVGNRSNANTAYSDFFLNNDLADSSVTHYAALYLNSSTYNDTTFGTAQAFPNQLGIQNTDGLVSLFSSTSTNSSSLRGINFVVGGTATTNEIGRFTTVGLGIGTTTPVSELQVASTEPEIYITDTDASTNNKHWFLENSGGTLRLATSSDLLSETGTSPFSVVGSTGVITVGLPSMQTAPLVIRGGASGTSLISLQRTVGATLTYDWSLAGGCLAFANTTAGFTTQSMCGDAGFDEVVYGVRNGTVATTRADWFKAKTFAASAGTDVPGVAFNIAGSLGTGAGTTGNINFYTANLGSTGTTQQTQSQRMTILGNTGKVGIGSTTPWGMLDAVTTTTGRYASLGQNGLAMGLFRYDDNAASTALRLENRDTAATTGHGVAIRTAFADDTTSTAINAGDIQFVKEQQWTNAGGAATRDSAIVFRPTVDGTATEKMRVASTGVGIGTTTSKASSLTITGSSKATYGNFSVFTTSGAVTDSAFSFFSDDNPETQTMTVLRGGTGNQAIMGIGTSSPWGKLAITNLGTSVPSILIEDSTSPDTSPFLIDASGNVGIGTSTPITPLTVLGNGTGIAANSQVIISDISTESTSKNARIGMLDYTSGNTPVALLYGASGAGNNELYIGGGTSALTAATKIFFQTAAAKNTTTGTTRMYIDPSGNVGIGTTTPVHKLQVTSGAAATTTVTIGELNLSTSKACVNMMTSAGTQASFYINAAGTMVTELNACR